ncbi:MAG: hypothetical protein LBJ64_04180, partial [Deltaproteobacteria bacterium]|nr:hypothetical protein [Deltaproteobacteria bacterium]
PCRKIHSNDPAERFNRAIPSNDSTEKAIAPKKKTKKPAFPNQSFRSPITALPCFSEKAKDALGLRDP